MHSGSTHKRSCHRRLAIGDREAVGAQVCVLSANSRWAVGVCAEDEPSQLVHNLLDRKNEDRKKGGRKSEDREEACGRSRESDPQGCGGEEQRRQWRRIHPTPSLQPPLLLSPPSDPCHWPAHRIPLQVGGELHPALQPLLDLQVEWGEPQVGGCSASHSCMDARLPSLATGSNAGAIRVDEACPIWSAHCLSHAFLASATLPKLASM